MTSRCPWAFISIHLNVPWPIRSRPPSVEMVFGLDRPQHWWSSGADNSSYYGAPPYLRSTLVSLLYLKGQSTKGPDRKGRPRRFSFIIGVIRRHMEINASLSYGVVAPASAFKINQQHRYGHKASMKWRCKAHMVQVEASIQLVEEFIARHVDLGSFRLLGGSVKYLQSTHDRVLFHPGLG